MSAITTLLQESFSSFVSNIRIKVSFLQEAKVKEASPELVRYHRVGKD